MPHILDVPQSRPAWARGLKQTRSFIADGDGRAVVAVEDNLVIGRALDGVEKFFFYSSIFESGTPP